MCLYLQTAYQATWWCRTTSAKVMTCMMFSLNTTALTTSAAPALVVSNPQTACESTCLVHNFLTCTNSFFLCVSFSFSLSLSLLSVCLSVSFIHVNYNPCQKSFWVQYLCVSLSPRHYHLFHHYSGSQCCYYCFMCSLLACRLAGTDCKNRQLPKILILV